MFPAAACGFDRLGSRVQLTRWRIVRPIPTLQIRPILSRNLFQCHGLDEKARKAKLRLDLPEAVSRPAKSGQTAIVRSMIRGKSALMARITAAADDDLMPPADTGKKLKPEQIEMLRRWIARRRKVCQALVI